MRLVVVAGDRRQVALARRAVRPVGEVARARRRRLRRRAGALRGGGRLWRASRGPTPARPGRLPRPVLREHRVDLPRSRIASRTCSAYAPEVYIAVWLMPAVLDAQPGQRGLHRRLEMLGPVRVRAAGRRRDRRQRLADVLGPGRVDARRHLPQPVEVVPGQNVHAVGTRGAGSRRPPGAGPSPRAGFPGGSARMGSGRRHTTTALPGERRSASAMTSSARLLTQSASGLSFGTAGSSSSVRADRRPA